MDWKTIIRSYSINSRPRKEVEFNWFRRQSSIESAIISATEAKDERGKQYSHQRRIDKNAIREAKTILLENADDIKKSKSFHHLWLLIRDLIKPISGIGDLYIYDTALRIGAFLNLLPDKVYLHAGTRKGAKAINHPEWKNDWIEIETLPKELKQLSADEIEDILCIYKGSVGTTGCNLPSKNCYTEII